MDHQTLKIIEISSYLIIGILAIAYRHILSGRKNGCFYHKNDDPLPPMLDREIKNIHFIESPGWYALHIVVFVFTLALQRALMFTYEIQIILIQLGISTLFTISSYLIPAYHFQRGITAGLKNDNELDKILKSEVAIYIFGIKIQFWKKRLFSNKGRIVAQYLGLLILIIAIYLLIKIEL